MSEHRADNPLDQAAPDRPAVPSTPDAAETIVTGAPTAPVTTTPFSAPTAPDTTTPAGAPAAPAAPGWAAGSTPPPPSGTTGFGSPSPYPAYGQAQPVGYAAPPPPLTPEAEKQVGALAHGISAAATFLSGGLLGLVAAIVLWAIYKDRGPFVREHTRNALNLQITVAIGLAVSIPLMFVLIGFVTYPVIWVVGLILHIVGVVKALNGEWWRPPMTLELVK